MTQEQLLKMDHLKIAEVEPGKFVHVHAEDDYRITSWHEGDDIKNYYGTVCMWMPIRDSYDSEYRVIPVTEHEGLEIRAREAHEAEMNEMRLSRGK